MLVFNFTAKRKPKSQNTAPKNRLKVLDFPSIPKIDLNNDIFTESASRKDFLNYKKGNEKFRRVFMPSKVVKLVEMKKVCPMQRATIIMPTSPAEKQVIPHSA
jgi:hypothetical protein